jgi:FkbM family methyltransferase
MKIIKSIIKATLNRAGYEIYSKIPSSGNSESMKAALQRLKLKGINPSCIIDIGAAQGTWTEKAIEYWPKSSYQLIEPLHEQKQVLDEFKKKHANINYHLAVAGEERGETYLNVTEDLDGSGVYGGQSGNSRKVPVITIDDIASVGNSFLIKLDTHGYEVPILKGAVKTLPHTEALIIEVYGFRISPTCLLFHELSSYLDTVGFRLVDIVDIMRRRKDSAFWQADAIYIRKNHSLFLDNRYTS